MESPQIEIPTRGQRVEEPLGDASILKPKSSVSRPINPDGGDSDVSRPPSPAAPQMETSPLQELINERDKHGNQGSTEPDFAESRLGEQPSQSERQTGLALSAGAPRKDVNVSPVTGNQGPSQDKPGITNEKYRKKLQTMKNLKGMLDTYLVVSTLVATVTFTAGFMVPGGYNTSDPNEGMATLLRHRAFQVFIICDTLAFYSSVVAMALLITGQLCVGHLILLKIALYLTSQCLEGALVTMSMAFLGGTYVVVSVLGGLSGALLGFSVAFVVLIYLLVLLSGCVII